MVGAVIIVAVMVLVGPVVFFVVGAIWSALVGQLLTRDAERRYEGTEYVSGELW